jgi:hypothetical protein
MKRQKKPTRICRYPVPTNPDGICGRSLPEPGRHNWKWCTEHFPFVIADRRAKRSADDLKHYRERYPKAHYVSKFAYRKTKRRLADQGITVERCPCPVDHIGLIKRRENLHAKRFQVYGQVLNLISISFGEWGPRWVHRYAGLQRIGIDADHLDHIYLIEICYDLAYHAQNLGLSIHDLRRLGLPVTLAKIITACLPVEQSQRFSWRTEDGHHVGFLHPTDPTPEHVPGMIVKMEPTRVITWFPQQPDTESRKPIRIQALNLVSE